MFYPYESLVNLSISICLCHFRGLCRSRSIVIAFCSLLATPLPMLRMTARSRSPSWRALRTTSSTRCSTSALTTSTIWLTARSTWSASTWRWRTRRGRLSPLLPAATLVLASSSLSSTSSLSTGLLSSTSRGHRSSTRLDSSSRRGRARGYRHLRLVLLHRHRRLHVRQLLPDSRLRDPLAPAFTTASRGTTPTLAPRRRRRDSRGAKLSPGRHFRAE